jgi:hypothetical protein
MSRIAIKICGLSTPETLDAALKGGASHVGFVHFAKSPRHVEAERLAALAARVPGHVLKVGVVVNPDDAMIEMLMQAGRLDALQLHGSEPPERVAAIRARFPFGRVRRPLRRRNADAADPRSLLERRTSRAKADPAFQAEMDRPCSNTMSAAPARSISRERLTEEARRREDLFQARRAEPHRRAQDQQLHRPDPAGPPHGQDAHHRRDRRGPARRRHGHGLRAVRPALRGLHGRHRCRAAEAQRVPHEAARRRGACR